MKRAYIAAMRALRWLLAVTGLLTLLDRWSTHSRTGLWLRSQFAIYDLDDLARLDVPWWTFASSDLVSAFLHDHPDARVFEWGAGSSTLWLAARAGTVVSVEHDPGWATHIASLTPQNATVRAVPAAPATGAPGEIHSSKEGAHGLDFARYVHAIDDEASFDVIVIDGRAREACLPLAITHLAPGGIIVFDNVDRERYRSAIAERSGDVDAIWTRGRTPTLLYPTRTAVLTARRRS